MVSERIITIPVSSHPRSFPAAAVTAIALLLIFGTGYRVLAFRLARPTQSISLPPGTLAHLPLQIGKWVGRDVPLDPAIIRATNADDHINRTYTRQTQGDQVSVFIAYGVRGRDLMPHRPDVCYPGAGWMLKETRTIELTVEKGLPPLVCRIYRFHRGGLDLRSMSVLNYYIVDGEYCPDVSLLRAKAWRGAEAIHYMAQVQIAGVGDVFGSPEIPEKDLCQFTADSAAAIRNLLPRSNATAGSR